jgi:hypothetical protein
MSWISEVGSFSITGNAGGAVTPVADNINIVGSGSIVVTGNPVLGTLTISGGGVSGMTHHALAVGTAGGSITSLGLGTNGTVLTGVTGADPAFSASPTVTTIYATTFDTNVAAAGVTLAGTTLSADGTDVDININITAKGAGKVIIDDLQLTTDLAVTEGGTGASSLLDHGLLVGSGTAAVDALSVGATGVILTGVTGADPTWTTATYPSTVVKGDVLVASANNVIGVVNDVVNAGYVLTANAAAAPTFQVLPTPVVASFASDPETIAGAVTNKAVAPSNLAAKLGTQTLHALPIGAGSTSALGWLAVGLNGQTIMGSTGADCGWTSSPQFGGSITATNDINTTAGNLTASNGGLIVSNNAVSTADAQVEYRKTRTSGIITSGDGLGTMRFEGYDGVSFISGAKIISENSGTVAVNRIAGNLKFYTHPDSVVALPSEPTLRMTIASTGAITIASPDSGTGLTVNGGGLEIVAGNLTLPVSNAGNTTGCIYINGHRYFSANVTNIDQMFFGYDAGLGGAGGNFGLGYRALKLDASGGGNFACGINALCVINNANGYYNAAMATASMQSMINGFQNCGLGRNSLGNIVYGNNNVAMGDSAGAGYTGNAAAESNNICIGSQVVGTAGEGNTIRIGNGTGLTHTACYIGGVYSRTNSGTQHVAIIDSNSKLGSVATLPPSLGGAMTWTEVTGTSQAAAVNNGYIASNVALVTVTLPATAGVGQRVAITGKGAGLWSLAQNAGQTVHFGSFDTTPGVGGSITAAVRYDCLEVQCITANTDWVVIRSVGALVIV